MPILQPITGAGITMGSDLEYPSWLVLGHMPRPGNRKCGVSPLCPTGTKCERRKGRFLQREMWFTSRHCLHSRQSRKEDSRAGAAMLRSLFSEVSLDNQPGVSLRHPEHMTPVAASPCQLRPPPVAQAKPCYTALHPVGSPRAEVLPAAPAPRHPLQQGVLLR